MARYRDGRIDSMDAYQRSALAERIKPLIISTKLENVRAKVRDDGNSELAEAIRAYRRRIEKSDGNFHYVLAQLRRYAGRHKKLDEFLDKEVPER